MWSLGLVTEMVVDNCYGLVEDEQRHRAPVSTAALEI